jgi:hypothetical protein
MKKSYAIIFLIIVLSFACKESFTEPEPEKVNDKYYLVKDGASFNYSLSVIDSNGYTFNGNRYMFINGNANVAGKDYKIQVDSFETIIPFDTLTVSSISYIEQNNSEVYTFADTVGFTGFLPNEYRPYLRVDRESKLLSYPIFIGHKFPVFTLSYSYLIIGISVIDVDATVESIEVLNTIVNNNSVQLNTFKIKFEFILRTSSTDSMYYSAYGWAGKDLGFVKWDGDSEVFNFLFNEIIFPPSTTIKMDLKEYQF